MGDVRCEKYRASALNTKSLIYEHVFVFKVFVL